MKTSLKVSRLAAVLALLFLLNSCCDDGVRSALEVEPRDQWIGVLNPLFGSVEIRLNNFQPQKHRFFPDQERAYLIQNDSQLSLLGESVTFDIPIIRRDPVSIYVSDINSQRLSIDAGDNRAHISIAMESAGREIWTNCIANAGCFAIGDRDVHVDDMVLEAHLEIRAEAGQVTYNPNNIEVSVNSSSVRVDGCHDDFFAFLCDIFLPDRESNIKSAIANNFRSTLASSSIRTQVSSALTRYVRDVMRVQGQITSASVLPDGSLAITHIVEDPSCD